MHNTIIKNQLLKPNRGDIGELVVAMALLYTADRIRLKKLQNENITYAYDCNSSDYSATLSSDINAIDFIYSIDSNLNTFPNNLASDQDYKDYVINLTTHFVRLPQIDDSIIKEGFKRHCGFILKENEKAVDLLIIMMKNVNDVQKFSAIYVQVKYYKNDISIKNAQIILHSANESIFTKPHVTLLQNNPSISISGNGEVRSSCTKYINRFNADTFRRSKRLQITEMKDDIHVNGYNKSNTLVD